eukprot:11223045-Lingulodinium_polyedra.AAC.1
MRLDIGDVREAPMSHDTWMQDVPNTLAQMQANEESLTEGFINLKNEMRTKLNAKVDSENLDAAIKTVRDM